MLPRSGAGTSRHSSYAAFAAATARSTSSADDFGNVPSVLPSAGLTLSNVSPEAASTHSPAMKFWNVFVRVSAMRRRYYWALIGRRVREGARDPRAPPVARLTPFTELSRRLPRTSIVALAAIDDHRHVRVVLVVLDHLVVELVRELGRDHAVDHRLSVSAVRREARASARARSGASATTSGKRVDARRRPRRSWCPRPSPSHGGAPSGPA